MCNEFSGQFPSEIVQTIEIQKTRTCSTFFRSMLPINNPCSHQKIFENVSFAVIFRWDTEREHWPETVQR